MKTRYMQRLTLVSALTLTAGINTGCSSLFGQEGYFRDRGHDYLRSDVIDPMEVPEGVNSRNVEQLYVIPSEQNIDLAITEEFEVPRPQPLSSNAFADKVKIQKLGQKRWILVHTEPSDVWPKVRNFLARNRLEVVFTDATNGIIETGWLQFKDDNDRKDKYRIQIEQGVQPDHTELHVLHMSVDRDIPGQGQVNWPEQSLSAEREAWMLDELAATLATDVTGQATSLLAQTIGVEDKVKLTRDGNEPILNLDLDFTRAWATVGHAVQQQGFRLWDQDNTMGVYYVAYEPVSEDDEDDGEPGFFSGLFGDDDESLQNGLSPYSLQEVLSHLQLEDTPENRAIFSSISSDKTEALKDVPGYLIVVRGLDENIEIRVRDGYARPLDKRKAKELLSIIRRNLI
jgi:outer membrane protein assembly factor BamC